jgi:hypothetical protein
VSSQPQPIMKSENTIYPYHDYDSDADNLTKLAEAPKRCPLKNPINVAFYNKGKAPTHPYQVIAKESVSQYNMGGIKRQEAIIHDVLRQLAASVGGDAVINITKDNGKICGEVVKFKV